MVIPVTWVVGVPQIDRRQSISIPELQFRLEVATAGPPPCELTRTLVVFNMFYFPPYLGWLVGLQIFFIGVEAINQCLIDHQRGDHAYLGLSGIALIDSLRTTTMTVVV